jgi:hypothetical protein
LRRAVVARLQGLEPEVEMLRAILVSLGLGLAVVWLVGLVDGSTSWLTWLDGVMALLTFLLAAKMSPDSGPIAASVGPGLIGAALAVLFVIGLAAHGSAWLVWFTFVFAGGYFTVAALAFFVRIFEPRAFSRTPITVH